MKTICAVLATLTTHSVLAWTAANWANFKGGDMDVPANWSPEGVPAYVSEQTDYLRPVFPAHEGDAPVTLGLSGDAIDFESLNFSQNAEYDLFFPGKVVGIWGVYSVGFFLDANSRVRLTGGVLRGAGGRKNMSGSGEFTVTGVGSIVSNVSVASGHVRIENGGQWQGEVMMSGAGSFFHATGAGTLVGRGIDRTSLDSDTKKYFQLSSGARGLIDDHATLSNVWRMATGNNGTGQARLDVSNATVWVNDGGIAMGSSADDSGNVIRFEGGSKIRLLSNNFDKFAIGIGRGGVSNTMVIAGAGTVVSNFIGYGTFVGHRSSRNRMLITDGAEFYSASTIGVADSDDNDTVRGELIAENTLIVSNAARVSASKVHIGRTANRGGGTYDYKGVVSSMPSNRIEVLAGAEVECRGSLEIAGQMPGADFCQLKVSGAGSKLSVGNSLTFATYGKSHRIDVLDGGQLTFKSTMSFGGNSSTGAVINISGEGSRLDQLDGYYSYKGSAPGHRTVLRVSDGGTYGGSINASSPGLTLSLSNGTIEVLYRTDKTSGYFEFADEVELIFEGTKPCVLNNYAGQPHIGFMGSPRFVFRVPATGYETVPLDFSLGGQKLRLYGSPKAEFDVEAFRANGGGRLTLIHSGAGFNFNEQTQQEILASLSENLPQGCRLYFAGDDIRTPVESNAKKLVLRAPSTRGMTIILR